MIETRVVDEFPLCDQEIMLRHLHTTARGYVDDHQRGRVRHAGPHLGCVLTRRHRCPPSPLQFADLEPFADWALPEPRHERYAKRLASTMDELQAFYDAAFPRLESSTDYLKSVALDGISDEDQHLLWLFSSLVTVSFPVEVWRQPRVPDSGAATIDVVVEPVP